MDPCVGYGIIIFHLGSSKLILEKLYSEVKASLFRHAFTSTLTSPDGNVYFDRKLKLL